MRAFLDTSVLIAAFDEDHRHHEPSFQLFSSLKKQDGSTAAHCLIEFYSVTTRLPGKQRASPQDALIFTQEIRDRLALITLDESEYIDVLGSAAEAGTLGGATYHALIARCALKAKAEVLYTWNIRHFQRHEYEIGAQVREP